MTVQRWLAFTPRDTVTVRDGRSFQAGTDSSAETVRPWPSTIAGAVRTAYGKEPEAVRGPVLARRTGTGGWEPYLPMPADVVRPPGSTRARLLRPHPELAGIATDLGEGLLAPPDTVGKVEEVQGWVPGARFTDYLHGTIRPAGFDLDETLRPYGAGRDPLVPERRVGLARTGGRTAREGFLYQSTHLRPLDGWSFLACNDVPEDGDWTPRGPTPFGGRGRLADVAEVSGVDWPAAPTTFPDGRVLVYLATPALWPGGWRPETPAGAELVGAAVPTPRPVATASPREARRAAHG
ncbi:hypothetical protein BJF79_14475 [Actinomadura sp. CNU-125]|uniref:type III-B CRISPR module-associated Cmr3 family protein n=1 Tax=Actinomadura sp. CNU-125 TaxID=1904961 RepID=UPI00096708A2|nr:type III-B CRISPR module-associated Cmr3 family protein [Actinomadura sp. CNU-125]OLT23345.1 hypothetical protein BJF79_14475 [Actinomadura sp. CNU-125]